jgi:hypothetical protein
MKQVINLRVFTIDAQGYKASDGIIFCAFDGEDVEQVLLEVRTALEVDGHTLHRFEFVGGAS